MLYVHDIGAYTHGAEVNEGHFKALMESGFKALEQLRDNGTIKAFGMGVNEVQVCWMCSRGPGLTVFFWRAAYLAGPFRRCGFVAALPGNGDVGGGGRLCSTRAFWQPAP